MRVLVFGAGAVGLGLTSCLLSSGHSPDIICRHETARALTEKGLFRTGLIGNAEFTNVKAYPEIPAIADLKPYDFILVSTKSNDTENTSRILSNHPGIIHEKTCIVLCQNGWGNREIFTLRFPSEMVYNARVITGFHRHAPNHVEVTVHAQPVSLGSLHHAPAPELNPLRDAIQNGGLTCEITDTIGKDLWAKMLFNCSLNPLGAIFNVPYGDLKTSPHTQRIMKDIVDEIFRVIHAAGYESYWSTPGEYYEFLLGTLIPRTALHESSTLQDIRAKKKTEIDALTGAVVALGERYNIAVPVNRMLYAMIRFMEDRYLS